MLVIRFFWLQAALAMAQLPTLDDLLGGDSNGVEEPAGSDGGGLVPGLQDLIDAVPVPTVADDIVGALPDPTEILDGVIGPPETITPDEEAVATPEPTPSPMPAEEESPAVEETPVVEAPTAEPTPEESTAPVVQVPVPVAEIPAVEEPTPAPAPAPSPEPSPGPAPVPAPIVIADPPAEQEDPEPVPSPAPAPDVPPAPSPDADSGAGGAVLLPLPSLPADTTAAPASTPAPTTTADQPANTSPFLSLVTPANGSPFMSVFTPPQPTQVNAVVDDEATDSSSPQQPPTPQTPNQHQRFPDLPLNNTPPPPPAPPHLKAAGSPSPPKSALQPVWEAARWSCSSSSSTSCGTSGWRTTRSGDIHGLAVLPVVVVASGIWRVRRGCRCRRGRSWIGRVSMMLLLILGLGSRRWRSRGGITGRRPRRRIDCLRRWRLGWGLGRMGVRSLGGEFLVEVDAGRR
ncbi:hypothetical protein QC764_608220 [Podospora pseudoanserina]|uniref:Uncharacterized protein n=1 Tax=Podospora pseudoanserina TaxID=2609844 RepID=A0ABR0HUW3_9PEZI|nr:hypothetical protein QC764_608220 [Podospora pseudoanserina]